MAGKKGVIALAAIAILLVLIATGAVYALLKRPFFSSSLLFCVALFITFVVTEPYDWQWHRARETENRFWSMLAVISSAALVFAPDSPLPIGREHPWWGFLTIFMFANFVHYYDRALSRSALSEPGLKSLPRVKSKLLLNENAAKEKTAILKQCIDALDFRFVALKPLHQAEIRRQEKRILDTFTECTKEELNYVVTNVNLALLFYKVKDRDLLAYRNRELRNRTALLELLAVNRLHDLEVAARVAVLDALQMMRISAHPKAEEWVRDIFLSTQGYDLTRLKCRIDTKGGAQNLHKLIWKDIKTLSIRDAIMTHLRDQADRLLASWGQQRKMGPWIWEAKERESRALAAATVAAAASSASAESKGVDDDSKRGVNRVPTPLYIPSDDKRSTDTPSSSTMANNITGGASTNNGMRSSGSVDDFHIEARRSSSLLAPCWPPNDPMMTISASSPPSTSINNNSINSRLASLAGSASVPNFQALNNVPYQRRSDNTRRMPSFDAFQTSSSSSVSPLSSLQAYARRRPRLLRKILSDVDDTLFSSGGSFPAGIDTTYAHHVLYPGVLTFYKELDLGKDDGSDDGVYPKDRVGNLAFLSARPHVYKDKSEKKSYIKFEKLRNKNGSRMHAIPTLLPGDLKGGLQMFGGDFTPLAKKKFDNFDQYAQLYPEFSFIFVGDNGQGDVQAAELIKWKYGDALEAVFIHQVQDIRKTPGYDAEAERRWADMKFSFFSTYIGAASAACHSDIIHAHGLRRIAASASEEFRQLQSTLSDREARRIELNRDIETANHCLIAVLDMASPEEHAMSPGGSLNSSHSQVCDTATRSTTSPSSSNSSGSGSGSPTNTNNGSGQVTRSGSLPLIPATCQFFPGSFVTHQFGVGKIVKVRTAYDTYQVALTSWTLSGGQLVHLFAHGEDLKFWSRGKPGTPVSTMFGTGILMEVRQADGVHVVALRPSDLWLAASPTLAPSLAYLQPDYVTPIKAAVGDAVTTPYGSGYIEDYRVADDTYVVLLEWGTTLASLVTSSATSTSTPSSSGSSRAASTSRAPSMSFSSITSAITSVTSPATTPSASSLSSSPFTIGAAAAASIAAQQQTTSGTVTSAAPSTTRVNSSLAIMSTSAPSSAPNSPIPSPSSSVHATIVASTSDDGITSSNGSPSSSSPSPSSSSAASSSVIVPATSGVSTVTLTPMNATIVPSSSPPSVSTTFSATSTPLSTPTSATSGTTRRNSTTGLASSTTSSSSAITTSGATATSSAAATVAVTPVQMLSLAERFASLPRAYLNPESVTRLDPSSRSARRCIIM